MSFWLFLEVAFVCSSHVDMALENVSLTLRWQQCPQRPLATIFSRAGSPEGLETVCEVLIQCAYSRPWRFEMLAVSVKWADSAVFLTLKLPIGSGAPSARWGFLLSPLSWSWWVAELKCSESCRNALACGDDTQLGFAFSWIPVKTHFSWLSEHAMWGECQW